MVSVLQNVKATMAWRKHQLLADFDENESPVPDKVKKQLSLSSLSTTHVSLRKRAPLKQVELNFHKTPTWGSLEARQKCQTLQSIKRTAKNAFGTVSQKMQKSCQSPEHSMLTFPAESISSCATSSTKKKTTPRTTCRKKNVSPAASSKGTPRSNKRALLVPTMVSKRREWRGFSSWLSNDAVGLRRSRRAAALKSPYSSPIPASRKIEFDCELELVSSGICQLECISQAFDDTIVEEESIVLAVKIILSQEQRLTPIWVTFLNIAIVPKRMGTGILCCKFLNVTSTVNSLNHYQATRSIRLLLSSGTELTVCTLISNFLKLPEVKHRNSIKHLVPRQKWL